MPPWYGLGSSDGSAQLVALIAAVVLDGADSLFRRATGQYLPSAEASALVGSMVVRHQRRRPSRDDIKIRSTCDPDHIGHPPLWS